MFKQVILLTGMPRSGTSWLSQIFDSSPDVKFVINPLWSYAFKDVVNLVSPLEEWQKLFEGLYHTDDDYLTRRTQREEGHYPTFPKNDNPEFLVIKDTFHHHHTEFMLRNFDFMKIVPIVRNPCGAINSWLKTPKELKGADPMEVWRSGANRKTGIEQYWGFNDWMDVTRLHQRLEKEIPDRCRIVQYEKLVDDPLEESKKMFEFCGMNMDSTTQKFLEDSHSKHDDDVYAVFKSPKVKGSWKEELHPDIRKEIFNDIQGTELERFLVE